MATKKEEAFLDQIETVSIASCFGCGMENKNWDEMQLVQDCIKAGWVVVDGNIYCYECARRYIERLSY